VSNGAHPKIETTGAAGRWQAWAWGDDTHEGPWIAYGDTEAEALRELALLLLGEMLEAREHVCEVEF